MLERLKNEAESAGIRIDDEQSRQFVIFYELLEEHRRRASLTSITGLERVRDELFLRSLEVAAALDASEINLFLGEGCRLLDVGSGAGFPGIPLAIAFPEVQVTLLDSVRKKTDFLQIVIDRLELRNVNVHRGRAEEIARLDEHRETYDLVTSRAVAALPELAELMIPSCRVGGIAVALKGPDVEAEAEQAALAATEMGASTAELRQLTIGARERPDTAVVWRKVSQTPGRYPRRVGIPHKRPLIAPIVAQATGGDA
ncbi:MAG: 16S rRNA (guanine(527)-N(7))-methyltransferase RsmG [Chloroflexi bacterium]|nr:16S rRNA (guanine(527)-N(7))-methyltransferase RsmG [Chloroflexota bacterium]